MYILSLEASTTSAKAMFYDTTKDDFELFSMPYLPSYSDVSIHKPDEVFGQLMTNGRALLNGREPDVICMCGAWHSAGVFDRNFRPVTPMYLWSNTDPSELCSELRTDKEYTKGYYSRTGCMVNTTYGFFNMLKLKREGLKLENYIILGQGSYNNFRMTGRRLTTDCHLAGSGFLNIHSLTYDTEVLRELGITQENLFRIVTYKEVCPLSQDAAALLGVKSGIPVILSCADGAMNQTGSGALADKCMTCSVGTSSAIRISSDFPLLSDDCSTWCYRTPDSWLCGAAINGGTSCTDWFKNASFSPRTSYSCIEHGADELCDGPFFLPFIFGERCPGWNDARRGGFAHLLARHTRFDLYRSVQEGVLFNLLQCYERLTAARGEPDSIRLSGGILNSELWTQMFADIFQKSIELDETAQSSLMGAVVLGKQYLGLINDLRDHRPKQSKLVLNKPENAAYYQERYEKYKRFYNQEGC